MKGRKRLQNVEIKMENTCAKHSKLQQLFLMLNTQICDALCGCLSSQIWMNKYYIRLIAMTHFFGGRGLGGGKLGEGGWAKGGWGEEEGLLLF